MKRAALAAVGVFFSAALVTWLISCGGGGGGAGVFDGTVNIGSKGQDHELTAAQEWSMAFTVRYDVGRFGGPFGSLNLNLDDNLSGITFTPQALLPGGLRTPASPLGTMGGQLMLLVARSEAVDTVCSAGELYGPFNVLFDGQFQPTGFMPSSAAATPTTMGVLNTGAYSVCVKVWVPVDGVVDLNRVGFQVAPCGEPPADIAGTWTGVYSCDGNCAESGSVTLVITQDSQDPSRAAYTDEGGATYEGTVCGSRFSFRGGLAGSYNESGTFVMNPDGVTASKTSSYRMLEGGCRGDCTDTLTRSD